MEPAYRKGDIIIVSPAAPIRRGDRVVVKTKKGEVIVKELTRRTAKTDRAAIAQCRSPGPHLGGRRRALDRAHRLGEPVESVIACHAERASAPSIMSMVFFTP